MILISFLNCWYSFWLFYGTS